MCVPSEIRHWLATPTNFIPPIPKHILQTRQIIGGCFSVWVTVQKSLSVTYYLLMAKRLESRGVGSMPASAESHCTPNELCESCGFCPGAPLSVFRNLPSVLVSCWVGHVGINMGHHSHKLISKYLEIWRYCTINFRQNRYENRWIHNLLRGRGQFIEK